MVATLERHPISRFFSEPVEPPELFADDDEDDFPAAQAKLPALPTSAEPGTEEKIRVMAQRFAQREQTAHPFDARYTGDARTLEFLALSADEQREALARLHSPDSEFSIFFPKSGA